jgi:hypothetical protein
VQAAANSVSSMQNGFGITSYSTHQTHVENGVRRCGYLAVRRKADRTLGLKRTRLWTQVATCCTEVAPKEGHRDDSGPSSASIVVASSFKHSSIPRPRRLFIAESMWTVARTFESYDGSESRLTAQGSRSPDGYPQMSSSVYRTAWTVFSHRRSVYVVT